VFDERGRAKVTSRFRPKAAGGPCIFEYIYFSRPDSIVGRPLGLRSPQGLRAAQLARRKPCRGSTSWCRLPDSGRARRGRLQPAFRRAVRTRHYPATIMSAVPSFSRPRRRARARACAMKHSANRAANRRQSGSFLIDDSLVRGHPPRKKDRPHDARPPAPRRSPFPPRLAAESSIPIITASDLPDRGGLLAAHP